MRRFGTLAAAVVLSGFAQRAVAAPADEFKPQFEKTTLEIGGKVLSPVGVRKPWSPVYRVGVRRISMADAAVEDGEAKDGKPAWSVPSADKAKIRWLGSTDDVALIAAAPPPDGKADAPVEIRRFDVAARKWLAPLVVPAEKVEAGSADILVDVLADDERVAVLTQRVAGDGREAKPAGYRVTMFRKGSDKPVWTSESFVAEGARPAPGVALMASVMPDYAGSDVRHLSWLGKGVLVCAGEKEDVIRLDAAGRTTWQVPRVWEFGRGFTGPSVWAHDMRRLGIKRSRADLFERGTPDWRKAVEEDLKECAPARAAFDKQFQCAIVGGPVVVRAPTKPGAGGAVQGDDDHATHIVIAIAKGPNAWNWGYLSDCVVYVITADGGVAAMANLTRMVHGRQFTVDAAGGLVWGCQKGAMVRLAGNGDPNAFAGMGPGAPDLIARVDWYRQFPEPKLAGWLSADKVRDVVAFGPTHAFRAVAGGYVAKEGDNVYHFPLSVVDLKTGAETTATLHAPFAGKLTLPESNFFGGPDTGNTHAMGPYMLGVTQLHLDGGRLEVTLGVEGSSAGVSFDVPQVAAQPAK